MSIFACFNNLLCSADGGWKLSGIINVDFRPESWWQRQIVAIVGQVDWPVGVLCCRTLVSEDLARHSNPFWTVHSSRIYPEAIACGTESCAFILLWCVWAVERWRVGVGQSRRARQNGISCAQHCLPHGFPWIAWIFECMRDPGQCYEVRDPPLPLLYLQPRVNTFKARQLQQYPWEQGLCSPPSPLFKTKLVRSQNTLFDV